MTSKEIEQNLLKLAENINPAEFIYDFLLGLDISKNTVTRLKKGDYNLSKVPGEVLYKGKIFFAEGKKGELLSAIDAFSKEERILRQNPRFLLVTDYETLVAKDMRYGHGLEIPLTELGKHYDFFLTLKGGDIYKSSNNNKADRDASYKMADLYDILVQDNPDIYKNGSHGLNVFLSRLLFCFFAEDTLIFPVKGMFTDALVQHTLSDGSDTDVFLNDLFKVLNTKDNSAFAHFLQQFPYVNGGLFRDDIYSPKFSTKSRRILVECGELDWSEINPDIFGSMIQAVVEPEQRSEAGMHYTSVPNIKKLIEPLFLDELYAEFEKHKNNERNLEKLLVRLSKIKFFDPACGSGNFLIITYKEIRLLEIKIIQRIVELMNESAGYDTDSQGKINFENPEGEVLAETKQAKIKFGGRQLRTFFTEISLEQFYGIEIDDFAHEMAILSLWLAEHQMNVVFEEMLLGYGESKPILPLKEAGKIVNANAVRTDWESVCPKKPDDEIYIIGNPPYLGSNLHTDEQRQEMQNVFGTESLDRLDYIGTWFLLATNYIQNTKIKCAFVSTNSITQGVQVPILWTRIFEKGVFINFAHLSFKWNNNAKGNAGVSVVIIGLSHSKTDKVLLYDGKIVEEVKSISPYLTRNTTTIVRPVSYPPKDFPPLVMGNKPADDGNLILNEKEAEELMTKYPKAKKYIKKFGSADDLINGKTRYCLWIKDEEETEAKEIPEIKQRTEKLFSFREKSKAKSTSDYARYDYKFRQICYKETDGIVIPRVSSERRPYIPLIFNDKDTIVSDATNIIYDAEPWLFGILHSRMHMVWVRNVGGKLKTDYRYSAKLCYNTFPFPELSAKHKETINQYVFPILEERAKYPEKTMAWLYNPDTMPKSLKKAHEELDEAIEKIYRLTPFSSDTERLEYLFRLYTEMTERETLWAKEKKGRKKK